MTARAAQGVQDAVINNTGMVVNDAAPGTDWGAVGISFLRTTGPLVARGNTIHGNRAPSMDYGYDGGAFEIYARAASGTRIEETEKRVAKVEAFVRKTIGEDDRVTRSIRDHMNIIHALEARDTARAEDLVRQHALGLAEHVARHADYLD